MNDAMGSWTWHLFLLGPSHLSSQVKSELLCYRILTVDWDPQGIGPQLSTCCCQDAPVSQRAQVQSQVSGSKCRLKRCVIVIICSVLRGLHAQPSSTAGKLGKCCLCEIHKTRTGSSLAFLFLFSGWNLENMTRGKGIEENFYTSLSLKFWNWQSKQGLTFLWRILQAVVYCLFYHLLPWTDWWITVHCETREQTLGS